MPRCPSTTLFSQCLITHLELEVVVEDAMQSSDVVNNAVPDGRTPTTTCVVHGLYCYQSSEPSTDTYNQCDDYLVIVVSSSSLY